MAAIRLHPVTKKPSVYWYEPNRKKDRKHYFCGHWKWLKGKIIKTVLKQF